MFRGKIINTIGFALLATAFAFSLWNVFGRTARRFSGNRKVIRMAHWRLEGPTIAGYQAVVDAYMKMHPDVIVEQNPVPLRIWPMWVLSRMIGENPPDVVNYLSQFIDDLNLVRHFAPMSEYIDKPNPYNEGTPLEGVPWRQTFSGDLATSFNESLVEFYALPTGSNSMRIFINLDLLARVDGPEARLPTDFREFLALAEKTREYGERKQVDIVPLAGSKDRSSPALDRLLQGLTQKVASKCDWNYDNAAALINDVYFGYVDGRWSLRDPEIKSTFAAIRAFNLTQDRGFLQRRQDEATFKFLQGRALMAPVFSIDAHNLIELANFEVGILGRLPFPKADDPEYGLGTYGAMAESAEGVDIPFVLSRNSPNFETALDFLHFLTSYKGNRIFTSISQYLSPVDGVPTPPGKEAFVPIRDGYPPGIGFFDSGNTPDIYALFLASFYLLTDRDGGVDVFIETIEKDFGRLLDENLGRLSKRHTTGIRRNDSLIAAYSGVANSEDAKRFQTLVSKQNGQEANNYRLQYYLMREKIQN